MPYARVQVSDPLIRSFAIAAVGRFNYHRGAITKHLSYTSRNLSGVIARSDDGVSADLRRMLDHDVKGIRTSFLAHLCPDGDIASHHLLKCGAERSNDVARSHYDPAYHTESLRHMKVRQIESRGHHLMRHRILSRAHLIRRALGQRIIVHQSLPLSAQKLSTTV